MPTIAELKREIKVSRKLIAESDAETKQRKETLQALITELAAEQNRAADWEAMKAGTLIRVGDEVTQPDDWTPYYFYAYLPEAEFPILCIHPNSRNRNQCRVGILNQEALLGFKYGRELTDEEKVIYKDMIDRVK